MKVTLLNCEEVIEREIADKECTRDTLALTYAFAIGSKYDVDFARINEAILSRYAPSGLDYIKRKAWQLIEQRSAAR